MDLTLIYDDTNQYCDLDLETINNGTTDVDLQTGNDLITATLVSLLSDRVSDSDWTLTLDKRGWWGDSDNSSPIGSRIWQLAIQPIVTPSTTLTMAESYANEALSWLVDDGVCKSVVATASFTDAQNRNLTLNIVFTKPDNTILQYAYVWNSLV